MHDITLYLSQYSAGELWNLPLLLAILVFPLFVRQDGSGSQLDYPMLQPSFTPPVKKILLFASFFVFYLGYGSPLQVLSNQLFTAKITQQTLLFFVVSPLLLLGLPERCFSLLRWNYRLKMIFRIMTHPFLALFVFQGAYAIYFIPSVFNALVGHALWDMLAQGLLFLLSLWTWWPIFSSQPDLNKLRELPKIFYVFSLNVIFILAVSPYLFLKQVLFVMPQAGRTSAIFNPLMDIQTGIAFILILHEVILAFILGWVILSWFKREDKVDPRDVSGLMGVRVLDKGKISKKVKRT